MRTYRCFTLNDTGLIAVREDIDAADDSSALEEGWRRVTAHQIGHFQSTFGLELWLGLTLVFTTRDHMPTQLAARYSASPMTFDLNQPLAVGARRRSDDPPPFGRRSRTSLMADPFPQIGGQPSG
jgi:hypothetical protein